MKLLMILISLNCFAIDSKDSKILFTSYLKSIQEGKEANLKSLMTKNYYDDLKKKKMIQQMFKMNKESKSEIDFDIKIKKAALDKDTYFIVIKDKEHKNFGHNWFRVIKEEGKYKIDGTRFFD